MNDYLKQRMIDTENPVNDNLTDTEQPKKEPHPVFIAFAGKKQSGKDTAAAMAAVMLAAAGKNVYTTAFAESLKGMCRDLLWIDHSLLYGSDDDKNTLTHIRWEGFNDNIRRKYAVSTVAGTCHPVHRTGFMTVREVLQIMGTDVFRSIYSDVWARAPFNKDWGAYDVVLLADCRFPNEKVVTEEHGGVTIRLERSTNHVDNHPSEIALDDEEFAISYSNDGTLEELRAFVQQTLENLHLI